MLPNRNNSNALNSNSSAKLRSARLITTPASTARILDESPSSSSRLRARLRQGSEGGE